jgi:hypothetical protein
MHLDVARPASRQRSSRRPSKIKTKKGLLNEEWLHPASPDNVTGFRGLETGVHRHKLPVIRGSDMLAR